MELGYEPELADDFRSIRTASLQGGYVQVHYRKTGKYGTFFPFTRWQYYEGARKFARDAPRTKVNEIDFGLEFAKWAEVELTGIYTHTFDRRRSSAFPFLDTRSANRVGLQVQWNY